MECWIYILSQVGSILFGVLSLAAISDALWKIKFVDSFLSAIMHCILSGIFGYIAWWLWGGG